MKHILILSVMSILCAVRGMAGIALLDITKRNSENEIIGDWSRSLYSASYLCDIAGYDYVVTDNLDEAMKHDLILLSSCIVKNSFKQSEWTLLEQWVNGGGVLVAPAFRSVGESSQSTVASLFGIDTSKSGVKSKVRTLITWNADFYGDKELEYIDDENERITSLGEIKTFSVSPQGCDVLAYFDNGDAAVVRNIHGSGKTYIAGAPWRDVVARSQLNKDLKACREYNNGFEPSADVWAFFLRSIFADSKAVSVWKFTVPGGYTQLLIPTHDCDSRTAFNEMHYMSEYEKSEGLSGHYFLTTHYFSDKDIFGWTYLSDFYNEATIPKASNLLKDGHTVGSHSICHFPDFNKVNNLDIVTKDEYSHRATCVNNVSVGASTWAEIVLSKKILEQDLCNKVRSFRSGHLLVNADMHAMLETGGYNFQSCYTSGDLLSEFPFFGRFGNQWEGDQSNVLTIPLHISDVYNNDDDVPLNNDTWNEHPAVDDWFAAMQKLRRNYASAVLLIHPNREWKMILQKRLVQRLDRKETALYNFEQYGDFWMSRLSADYSYQYDAATGVITIQTDTESMFNSKMTFAVEVHGENISNAVIENADGSKRFATELRKLTDSRYLVVPKDYHYNQGNYVDTIQPENPECAAIYTLDGRLVGSTLQVAEAKTLLPKGIYIVKDGTHTVKLKI